jgi:hypothetical protein
MKKTAIIYNIKTGHIIAGGLESAIISDRAIQAARRIACERGHSVVVEDYGKRELYRITPSGRKCCVPGWWQEPDWDF